MPGGGQSIPGMRLLFSAKIGYEKRPTMRYGWPAMTPLQALILALIQGITEFLPISSSAHAILTPILFGWRDQGLTFDIVTNAGTLTAVLIYFRQELWRLATDADSWRLKPSGPIPLGPALVVGTVPVVLCGLLFYPWLASDARNPLLIAATSIGFGLLLAWADYGVDGRRRLDDLRLRDVVWIGLAQAAALIPGTSRSGATITAGLFLGFDREQAARFSFLLSIPAGLAALAHDALDLWSTPPARADLQAMVIGYVAAAISAYLVIDALLAWLRRQGMAIFVVYRVILGLVILGIFWLRRLESGHGLLGAFL